MINMLQKIGIKSKNDNKSLQEGKQVPANHNHFKVTFNPENKQNKKQSYPSDYNNYSNCNKRKDIFGQYKHQYREKPLLSSDRSTDSVPVRLSDPCIVQWKNRDVYVYTVESGQEKSAYPDLEFVIYIPVDTPVEWNLPTGVISTQTVSSSGKQKRGKRPALTKQEGHEKSESENHEHEGHEISESSETEDEGENDEKPKRHEIREDEGHEKHTGKQHEKQREHKISKSSATEGEGENHEKHKGHEIREDDEHKKDTGKQHEKQREHKISKSSATEGEGENHEKHKEHEIREDEEYENDTGKQQEKQREHKISKSSDTEREHSRNMPAGTQIHDRNKPPKTQDSSRSGTDDESRTTDKSVQFRLPQKK